MCVTHALLTHSWKHSSPSLGQEAIPLHSFLHARYWKWKKKENKKLTVINNSDNISVLI